MCKFKSEQPHEGSNDLELVVISIKTHLSVRPELTTLLLDKYKRCNNKREIYWNNDNNTWSKSDWKVKYRTPNMGSHICACCDLLDDTLLIQNTHKLNLWVWKAWSLYVGGCESSKVWPTGKTPLKLG